MVLFISLLVMIFLSIDYCVA